MSQVITSAGAPSGSCGHCNFCRESQPEKCIFPKKKSFSEQTASAVISQIQASSGSNKGSSLATKADLHAMFGNKGDKNGKDKKGWGSKTSSSGTYEKCAFSHPPLKLGEYTVYGGSASMPLKKDHDIYVPLDGSSPGIVGGFPWDEGYVQRIIIPYYVPDMNAPKDPVLFKKMILWLCEQIKAGKKVHVGCIGGHGRTGTLLAALAKELIGEEDAIEYVRKNYCQKAVESQDQVEFLFKHFGIKKQKPNKSWGSSTVSYSGGSSQGSFKGSGWGARHNEKFGSSSPDIAYPVKPLRLRGNIWGIVENVAKAVAKTLDK